MSENSVYLILLLPLISFLIQIFTPNFQNNIKIYLSSLFILICFVLSSVNLFSIYKSHLHDIDATSISIGFNWISLSDLSIDFGMLVDSTSMVMLVAVSLVSFLVHIFSIEYMRGDQRYSRYFAYLGLFTFSMNGIVLSDNLFFTFIFWELVGFSSFLLIGFWYEKDSAGNAAKKAFLVNRVGDIGMFLGIMTFYFACGSFNYAEIASAAMVIGSSSVITIGGLLVFMGAIGKSAQLPLHVWLPDAMEGPTPVSALIHAATMVAAGVYMTLRIFPFLTLEALFVIAFIGAITALIASLIATSQNDIKKILAYSTVSQLGYMICSIGVGAYFAAFFHLITHAMFKACLFLASGSIIHSMHHSQDKIKDHSKDPQDIMNMGGLKSKLPITFYTMLISTLSLCGFPLFSGFLSKDSIIAGTIAFYHQFHGFTLLVPILIIFSAGLTSFYMFRLIYLTFFGEPNDKALFDNIKEPSLLITFPLIILALLSFSNIFTFPNINPFNAHGWFEKLITLPTKTIGYDMMHISNAIHHAHYDAMIWSIIMAFLGFFISTLLYLYKIDLFNLSNSKLIKFKHSLFSNKFYFDELYDRFLVKPFLNFSNRASILDWDFYDQIFIDSWGWITLKLSKISAILDYSVLDQIIVDGFAKITNKSSKELQSTQNGVLQSYLISGVLGLIVLIIIIQQLG